MGCEFRRSWYEKVGGSKRKHEITEGRIGPTMLPGSAQAPRGSKGRGAGMAGNEDLLVAGDSLRGG
jgi:hypothetical protein